MSKAGQPVAQPLLLADIGGTHARFLLTHAAEPPPTSFPAGERLDLCAGKFDSPEDLLAKALEMLPAASRPQLDVVLAVAGPVCDDFAAFTNRLWFVNVAALKERFGFRRLQLVNDVHAAALALAKHMATGAESLQDGDAAEATRNAVISVGTGLGAAFWQEDEVEPVVTAAEPGHAGFAPADAWQAEWLERLQTRYGRVSWERVLSGDGLASLDAWLRDGELEHPGKIVERARQGSAAAARAIRHFCNMLGVFAGDLALAAPATGGIWLAGGVLAGIDTLFDRESFLQGFHAKGRVSDLMHRIPVHWTHDRELGLRGAWLVAQSPSSRIGRRQEV